MAYTYSVYIFIAFWMEVKRMAYTYTRLRCAGISLLSQSQYLRLVVTSMHVGHRSNEYVSFSSLVCQYSMCVCISKIYYVGTYAQREHIYYVGTYAQRMWVCVCGGGGGGVGGWVGGWVGE
jgi:hypothetical protein